MHKFKAGDWVRFNMDFNEVYQVTEVHQDYVKTNSKERPTCTKDSLIYLTNGSEFLRVIGTNFVFKPESIGYETLMRGKSSYPLAILSDGLIESEYKVWFLSDCELWEPKPGEWCWVFNKLMEIPVLRRVIRVEDNYSNRFDDDKFTKAVIVGRGDALDEEVGYRFCEPYIGTLPSTIEQFAYQNDNQI